MDDVQSEVLRSFIIIIIIIITEISNRNISHQTHDTKLFLSIKCISLFYFINSIRTLVQLQ